MPQMVPADELNASIAYSEEWKALEDHVSAIEKMYGPNSASHLHDFVV